MQAFTATVFQISQDGLRYGTPSAGCFGVSDNPESAACPRPSQLGHNRKHDEACADAQQQIERTASIFL